MSANGSNHGDLPTERELEAIESAFHDIETQTIRFQAKLSEDVYARRAGLLARIPNFWQVVFENPPEEFASALEAVDAAVFTHLTGFSARPFELEASPRSFELTFEFSENEYFADAALTKRFWYRSGLDGWAGLVSEPVRIGWKAGKDLTAGLLDASADLFEVEAAERAKKAAAAGGAGPGRFVLTESERDALPAHQKLRKMLHDLDGPPSFFTFFGFVSDGRFVTAEEAAEAADREEQRKKRQAGGEDGPGDGGDEDEDVFGEESVMLDVDVCPSGGEIATILHEDLWPNALRFYAAGTEDHEMEFGSDPDSDDDVDDDDEPPKLVKKRTASSSAGPDSKKRG